MKKTIAKKLTLSKETLSWLTSSEMKDVQGGVPRPTTDSNRVCC